MIKKMFGGVYPAASTMAFAVAAVFACLLSPASSAFAQEADLMVTNTGPASVASSATDTNVTYTINVLNVGPDDSASASLNDPIPPGMTFVSLSSPGGWSCTAPAVGAGGTVNCLNALFAAGGNVNFSLTLAIPGGTPPGAVFTNIASVSSASDPTDENNSSTAVTFVSGAPSSDVRVTKTAPATVQAGANLTYTLQTGNSGPDAASNVQLTDNLPGSLTFVSLSSPPGWSCTTPAVGAGGTIACSIATLAAGASGTFTLTTNVPSATPAGTEFTNTATISTANDPTPENDQSTATTTTIAPAPDLAIAKTHSGNATLGQTGFAYTITVSNAGAAASSGTTTVQDVLPPGLTATAISGPGWVCALATASCTRSDALGAGASYPPITLTANVAWNAASVVTNTATVTNAGDVDTSNNGASDPTNVASPAGPDLSIAKTHSGDARNGQSGFVYTITVRNAGNGPSSGTVTVTDALPAKLTATAASGAGGPARSARRPSARAPTRWRQAPPFRRSR